MQKKLFVSLLTAVALICACAFAAGAVDTPVGEFIKISSAKELCDLAHRITDKQPGYNDARKASYQLTKDIDMSGITDMVPIGANAGNAFTGTFDGNGYKIYNLKLTPADGDSGNYWGLFGRIAKPAVIRNLTVEGTVTSGGAYVGGIVGLVATGATIENCVNRCTVTYTGDGTAYGVGGVVGHAGGASKAGTVTAGSTQTGKLFITNCRNEGEVTGSKGVGGILGRSDITTGSVEVTGCVNTGNVTATIGDTSGYADVGGIAGIDMSVKAATNHVFSGCINLGKVAFAKLDGKDFSSYTGIGFQGVGGIIGRTQTTGIEVTGCYNGGTVTSDGQDAAKKPGTGYAMVIVGKSPVAPKNSNNYYKPGAGVMNSVKAIAVVLAGEKPSAAIYSNDTATVRYITKLTTDDANAVESYGIMIAQTAKTVNVKSAELTDKDKFDKGTTSYAVDLVNIPEGAFGTKIYAWAYVNLQGGVQIVLPIDAVTVNDLIPPIPQE